MGKGAMEEDCSLDCPRHARTKRKQERSRWLMTALFLLTLGIGDSCCYFEDPYLPVSSTPPAPCRPGNPPCLPTYMHSGPQEELPKPTSGSGLGVLQWALPCLILNIFQAWSNALDTELCRPNSRLWITAGALSFGVPGLHLHQLSPAT